MSTKREEQLAEVVMKAEEATRRLGVILAHVLVKKEPMAVAVVDDDGHRHSYLVKVELLPEPSEAPQAQLELLECHGHPAGPTDPMGETVYCDGRCRPVAPVIRHLGPAHA
ncbi:hypothetical protein [Hyalangium sp.]|uniref:hypothetical protein n=1 Tax=Hyalangium sp. TaxID=2028555 RepID=UPI002D68CDDE|nr:hypothetical protein [Hyalangium sp.]HYH96904.1 hypothetical protein [Hyalangium sp.]